MDDFRGHCGTGKYPLLTAIASALAGGGGGGGSSSDFAVNTGLSDVTTSVRLHGGQQLQSSSSSSSSSRSHQIQFDLPSPSSSRPISGSSSSSRSRFASSGSSSDVVHSGGGGGADVSDSENLFTARRSTSGGQQQLRRQQSGLAEYDDVSSSSGRRQSASFDDVNFSGGRHQQQRPRQESAAAQDVSGYRGRKFSDGGDGGGQSWDDDVTSDRVGGDAGRGVSGHSTRLSSSRRYGDVGLRNDDAVESDVVSSGRAAGGYSSRSRTTGLAPSLTGTIACRWRLVHFIHQPELVEQLALE